MNVTEETIAKLGPLYKERLESFLISEFSELMGLDAATSIRLYYQSDLAKQIEEGLYGIQYMSPKYLARELKDELTHLECDITEDSR